MKAWGGRHHVEVFLSVVMAFSACSLDTSIPDAQLVCDPSRNECPSGYACVTAGARSVCCKDGDCGSSSVQTVVDGAAVQEDADGPSFTDGAAVEAAGGTVDADLPSDVGPSADAPGPGSTDADSSVTDAAGDGGTDTGACQPACTRGATSCGGSGGVRMCVEDSKSGCLAWGPEVACPGTKRCQGSQPGASCSCPAPPPGCENGAGTFCKDLETLETCAMDAEGCVSRKPSTTCPTGKPCSGTFPSASCSCAAPPVDCTAGAGNRCAGNSLLVCGTDARGCLAVSSMTECPPGSICTGDAPNASCACKSTCTMSQVGTYCKDSKTVATCSATAGPPVCFLSSGETTCPGDKICVATGATASCQCPNATCSPGDKRCGTGGGVQSCAVDSVTICPAWSAEVACGGGQKCAGSGQASACGCPAAGMTLGSGCAMPSAAVCIAGGPASCLASGPCLVWQSAGSGVPAMPGPISGPATVCQGQGSVSYTVGVLAGASTYTWTFSGGTGFSITAGGATNSITAAFSAAATSGTLTAAGSNVCGSGPASTALAITVNPSLAAPTTNPATGVAQTSFTANWTAVSGASEYRLDVSGDPGFANRLAGYDDLSVGTMTAASVTGLNAGGTYYYRVRAQSSCGPSASSNATTVNTLPADKAWATPAPIDDAFPGGAFPKVGMDANGNGVAVWFYSDAGVFSVVGNRFSAGSTWGTATLLETRANGAFGEPRLAMNKGGAAVAVWYQGAGANSVFVSRFTSASGWEVAKEIDNDVDDAMFPVIGIDDGGGAIATWNQFHSGGGDTVSANRMTASGTWSTATAIHSSGSLPIMAVDPSGNATVLVSGTGAVAAVRYTVGVGWGSAAAVTDTGMVKSFDIAADGQGNVFVVWAKTVGTTDHIWANRYAAGAGWGSPVAIDPGSISVESAPRVAVDAAGNAIVVYGKQVPPSGVWYARYVAGSGWAAPNPVLGASSDYRLAFEAGKPNANAMMVFTKSDGTRQAVWGSRFVPGTGWETPVSIPNQTVAAQKPAVAMGGNGTALAVWEQADGGPPKRIWASVFK